MATGLITVADPTLLDYETNPTFTLQVQVTDSGAPALSDTAFVTIQLNDLSETVNPPPGPGPGPGPIPPPPPGPGPTPPPPDPGPDDGGIDLGGPGGGGTPAPEPTPEPVPAPEPVPEPVVEVVTEPEPEPAPEPVVVAKAEPVEKPKRVPVSKTPDVRRSTGQTEVFNQALDVMSEEVGTTNIFEEAASNPLQATFKGGSFVLSAGFLTWALRGASLIASMAASMPAWQGFDPLPVLAAKKRDKRTDKDEQKDDDDDWQEKRVQRLLDPVDAADKE